MKIDEIIQESREKEYEVKSGGNSKCIVLDNYALLYGTINIDEIELNKGLLEEAKDEGVQVAKILEYKLDEEADISDYGNGKRFQNGWTLQEKAKGCELYDQTIKSRTYVEHDRDEAIEAYKENMEMYVTRLNEISKASKEQLMDFVKGYDYLNSKKLGVDPSKTSNFFYSEEEGFSFIDLLYTGALKYEKRKEQMPSEILRVLTNFFVPILCDKDRDLRVMNKEQYERYYGSVETLVVNVVNIYRELGIPEEQYKQTVFNVVENAKEIVNDFEPEQKQLKNEEER